MNLNLTVFVQEIQDEDDVIILDEFKGLGTHWIALYVNVNNVIHFRSFAVEHIPKEI